MKRWLQDRRDWLVYRWHRLVGWLGFYNDHFD